MKTLIVTHALICFLVLCCAVLNLWGAEYDKGLIDTVSEGTVTVRGDRGLHVLETLRECSWCEEGGEVVVAFKGYGRATIRPASKYFLGRPLPAIVIRDGREGE